MNLFSRDPLTALKDFSSYWAKEDGTEGRIDWEVLLSLIPGGFVFVGSGQTYETVYDAISDGKYRLALLSDTTELTSWNEFIHLGIPLFIYGIGEKRTINMSQVNNSYPAVSSNIYFNNINLSLSGTGDIFYRYNNLFFDNCTITGDSDNNVLCGSISSFVEGTNLEINTGTGSLTITYVRNVEFLKIIGSGISSGIQTQDGVINYLVTSGTFGNDPFNNWFISLNQTAVLKVDITHTDRAAMRVSSFSSVLGSSSSTRMNIFVLAGSGVIIRDCYIDWLRVDVNGVTVSNCDISDLNVPIQKSFKLFVNNIVAEAVTISLKNTLYNCVFDSISVTGDEVTLTDCETVVGTITIDAAADKTTVKGCRTVGAIVNNGTNTQLSANQT